MSEYLDPSATNPLELPDRFHRVLRPGDAVKLVGKHPHAGKSGIYRGVNVLVMGGAGAKVDLAEGGGCYVFNASEWERQG